MKNKRFDSALSHSPSGSAPLHSSVRPPSVLLPQELSFGLTTHCLKTTAEFWEPSQAVSEGQKVDLNPEPEEILPLP